MGFVNNGRYYIMAVIDTHVNIEELLEAVLPVRSVSRVYNRGQLPLEESWDGGEKSRRLVWDGRQSVRTWARKQKTLLDPSPGNDWWRHSRLRRLSTCCSELQNAWISDSAIVTCSWDLSLWSSGQRSWLQIQRSRVRFPALPDFSDTLLVWNGVHSPSWGDISKLTAVGIRCADHATSSMR
jgi:hypothetical protein